MKAGRVLVGSVVAVVLVLSACGGGEDATGDPVSITLVTHDSFAVCDGFFDAFKAETGIKVEVLQSGDAGTLVNQSVLTAGNPWRRAVRHRQHLPLPGPGRRAVRAVRRPGARRRARWSSSSTPNHLVTPIDVGDVCVNYSKAAFPDAAVAPR